MKKFIVLIGMFLLVVPATAQEMNCQVMINSEQTGLADMSLFNTLQNDLQEFINQTRWTDMELEPHERIDCSMFLNITGYDGGNFQGTLQVQSSRPVYGSTMTSPVFNFKDEDLEFEYTEYQPLNFDLNEYESDLVSTVAFYVYTLLGLDADTFEEQAGTAYYEIANQIVNTAQQGGRPGWKAVDGNATRNRLNADLLSNTFSGYRSALYDYHRQGLDLMHQSPAAGKEGVATAILDLERMNDRRPGSLLLRTFFDAKADEVQQIFSGGPEFDARAVIDALNKIAPTFSRKWAEIR